MGSRMSTSSADSSGILSLGQNMLCAPQVPASLSCQDHMDSLVHPEPLPSSAPYQDTCLWKETSPSSESLPGMLPKGCSEGIPMGLCGDLAQCTRLKCLP